MAETRKVVRIFVASPDDVGEERKALEGVFRELNKTLARELGMYLELVSWDTDAVPGVSTDPQSVINEQIANDYDVFLGIMWARFGSPTARAGSGTEEEFERAYQRWQRDDATVDIMFYFKDEPIPPSKIVPDQLAQVEAFKNKLADAGVLYSEFSLVDEFEKSARMHLARKLREWTDSVEDSPQASPSQHESTGADQIAEELIFPEGDEGFLDLIESGMEAAERGHNALARMTTAQTELGESIGKRASEYEAIDSEDPSAIKQWKRVTNSAAQDMEQFVTRMDTEIPIFSQSYSSFIESFGKAALMVPEFEGSETNERTLLESLEALGTLLPAVSNTTGQMEDFRATIESLPRVTTRFNKAKRATLSVVDALIDELETTYYLAVEAEDTVRDAIEQLV